MDKKSLETVFLIAICRQSGNKYQSKTLFLMTFYLHLSIVLNFDFRLPGVKLAAFIIFENLSVYRIRNQVRLTPAYSATHADKLES